MATTTPTAIRDRCLTVIEAVVPTADTATPFKRYRNEGEGNFRLWAQANPEGATRRVQVRWTGADDLVDVSNTDIERHYVTLIVIVAYAQTQHWGYDAALDRDDAMDQDRYSIDNAVGLNGAANFTPVTGADSTFMGSTITQEVGDGVDFLVITQKMMYSRDVSKNALVAATGGNVMIFKYIASGAESVNGFSVALPVPRVNQYAASVTCGPVAFLLYFETTNLTTTTITVIPSASTTAGDVYFVRVEDLTS